MGSPNGQPPDTGILDLCGAVSLHHLSADENNFLANLIHVTSVLIATDSTTVVAYIQKQVENQVPFPDDGNFSAICLGRLLPDGSETYSRKTERPGQQSLPDHVHRMSSNRSRPCGTLHI